MITIAIVEDDKKSAKILQDYILRYSEEKQEPLAVECFENGLNFISDYKASCDIALMDIEMPHMNGLDTARKLREFDSQIPLIFITNMAQYAINGYEVQALDFMVKPIEYFNFSLKLDKAIRICKKLHGYQIYVPSEQGTVKIDIADLIYIESAKHYLYLHTSKETFRLRSTMGDFIAQLPTGRFSCCSKSFCVNLEWISRYQGNSVFVNGKELSISRSYKKTFIDQMTMYINRASRVTVFRDSQYIGTYDVDGITNADLIKAMVGRESKDLFPKPEVKIGDEMLRIEHLSRTGYFKDVSFNVRAGEIVGLTGLVGAGRTEVVESVCGITNPDEGKVYLEGKEVHIKQPSDAMKEGIILLPEDRQKEGLIMSWGLGRNVTLPTISKYAKNGFNDEKTERDLSKRLLEEVDTKAVDIFQPASSLSGGNQQKVVVAKALSQEMKVVIMDEPTKGVDVGAKAEIYAIMGDLAKKGYAIILISSEMPEILGMSDRIVVMCNGRKTGELGRGEATQEMILELAMEKGTTGKGAAK